MHKAPKTYRPRESIVADLLKAVRKKGNEGAKPAELAYGANINFAQLNLYMPGMLKADLLDKRSYDGKTFYFLKEDGMIYLRDSPFILEKQRIIDETRLNVKASKTSKKG